MIEYPPDFQMNPRDPTSDEIRAAVKVLVLRRLLIGLIVLAVVIFGGLTSVGVLLIRTTQTHNSPILNETQAAAKAAQQGTGLIIDCTTPGGACYNRSLKAQAKAVGTLNQFTTVVTTLSASCATQAPKGPFSRVYRDIYRCVQHGLRVQAQQDH
jgi:hypothetical protein